MNDPLNDSDPFSPPDSTVSSAFSSPSAISDNSMGESNSVVIIVVVVLAVLVFSALSLFLCFRVSRQNRPVIKDDETADAVKLQMHDLARDNTDASSEHTLDNEKERKPNLVVVGGRDHEEDCRFGTLSRVDFQTM